MQTFTATEIVQSILDIFYHAYEIEIFQGALMMAIVAGIVLLVLSIIKIKI